MTTIIERCRGEKTRGITAIDGFKKKLMILDFEIPKCPKFEVKSKIGKFLRTIISLKNILLRLIKFILIFINTMKKIQVDKNGCKYILFRIDIFFNKFLLAVEIDEKGHIDRDLIFEKKRQEALEKKLGCKFMRIDTSNAKNGYDLDYEVGNAQAFIDEFKNKKIKKTRKNIRNGKRKRQRTKRKIRKRNKKEIEKQMREKLEKEMREKIEKEAEIKELNYENKELKKKINNSTTNKITNNFENIIIKNW